MTWKVGSRVGTRVQGNSFPRHKERPSFLLILFVELRARLGPMGLPHPSLKGSHLFSGTRRVCYPNETTGGNSTRRVNVITQVGKTPRLIYLTAVGPDSALV